MSRKCSNCGTELHADDVYCPVCGIKTESTVSGSKRVCRYCGAALSEDAAFCSECGREQNTNSYETVIEKKTTGSSSKVIIDFVI